MGWRRHDGKVKGWLVRSVHLLFIRGKPISLFFPGWTVISAKGSSQRLSACLHLAVWRGCFTSTRSTKPQWYAKWWNGSSRFSKLRPLLSSVRGKQRSLKVPQGFPSTHLSSCLSCLPLWVVTSKQVGWDVRFLRVLVNIHVMTQQPCRRTSQMRPAGRYDALYLPFKSTMWRLASTTISSDAEQFNHYESEFCFMTNRFQLQNNLLHSTCSHSSDWKNESLSFPTQETKTSEQLQFAVERRQTLLQL